MSIKSLILTVSAGTLLFLSSCNQKPLGNFNLFPIEDDMALGKQVSDQIANDPSQYPVLRERGNEEVYRYIRTMTRNILNSGAVQHKDKFKWEVKIIDDDKTLNAFAAPGGYIYVYTGLIKFLDTEDQLAGVMGHEIAHADRRHSTKQMSKSFGIGILAEAALGQQGNIRDIAAGLVNLRFSRSHESESDAYSVIYLCNTKYNATGAAGFFRKMEGRSGTPEFLSTHPNPSNRVEKIEAKAKELGCAPKQEQSREHNRIKALLR
ncbi:MAG: M48 family metallopeptidase [Bacteroidota bacterium]